MKKLIFVFLMGMGVLRASASVGTHITVAVTTDTSGATNSLRAAIMAANNDSTASHFPYFITLPAGTYVLTQGQLVAGQTSANYGSTETIGTGFGTNIVFLGAGAASTIITQSDGSSRVFLLDAAGGGASTYAFSGVTIAGGNDTFNDTYGVQGLGGGGIFSGDEALSGSAGPDKLFLTNCVFANNISGLGNSTIGGGAAIYNFGGSVYMTNCVFTNNAVSRSASLNAAADLFGGAVSFESADTGDTLTAVGCVFLNNSCTAPNPTHTADNEQAAGGALACYTGQNGVHNGPSQTLCMTNCFFLGNSVTANKASSGSLGGGAMYVGGTAYVIGCAFTNNAANGTANLGGAISIGGISAGYGSGAFTFTAQYCRFVGNTVASGGSGSQIYATGSATMTDCWWGQNTQPGSPLIVASTGTLTNSPWLELKVTAASGTVASGATDTLTASFLTDSGANNISASNLGALTNVPVTFAGTDGTISGAPSVIQTTATAAATFTGTTAGTGSGSATVDGVTATAAINVTASVTSISSSPSSHYYKAGQTVPVTVTFSGNVTVTGSPQLALGDGGTATYASGSGTSILTFNYTVGASDTSSHLDYASTSALTLNSGTITGGGLAASLTLPTPGASGSLSANTTLVIDTTAPTVAVGSPSASYGDSSSSITFTVTYTDAHLSNGTLTSSGIALTTTGGASGSVAVTPGSGTSTSTNYTVTLSSLTGNGTIGIVVAAGTSTDLAGNTNAASSLSTTFTVDTTVPVVTFGSPSVLFTNAGGSVTYTVSITDANFSSANLSTGLQIVATGSASDSSAVVTPGSGNATGTNYTVTISGFSGTGTLKPKAVAGTAIDLAGNQSVLTSAATAFTVDTTPPTVAIGSPSVSYTNGSGSVSYTVTYTDSNLGHATLTSSGIALTTTGTAGAGSVVVTPGSGTSTTTNYTVTVSSLSGNGTAAITVAASTCVDKAGNANSVSSLSTAFTVDTTAPTVTVGSPSVAITNGSGSVSFTVTYRDTDFQNATLTSGGISLQSTGNASGSVLVLPGSGTSTSTNYTVTVTNLTGNGTLGITVAAGTATDLAGNSSLASSPSATFAVDTTPPTVTIGPPSVAVTNNSPVSFTLTFSDSFLQRSLLTALEIATNITGTAALTNITVTPGSGTATSTNYQVTISGLSGDGTLGFTIPAGVAYDSAGNSNAVTASSTFVVDNTPPSVAISAPSVAITNGAGSVSYTVTYSDANLANATLTAGGITANTTGTAAAGSVVVTPGAGTSTTTNYTVTLSSLSGDGTIGIAVAAGTATDLAGNTSLASGPSTSFTVDSTLPAVNISAPSVSIANGTGSASFTVTYSDANLNHAALTSGGVSLQSTGTATGSTLVVPGSGTSTSTNYMVTVSGLAGDGTIGIVVAAGTATDLAGNASLASSPSTTFTVDNTPPIVTISAPSATGAGLGGSVSFTVSYFDVNFAGANLTPAGVTLTNSAVTGTVSITTNNATNFTVTLANLAGAGSQAITVAAGTGVDLAGNASVLTGASASFGIIPVVSGLSPAMGPAAGGTQITITGSAFAPNSTVQFGSNPGTSVVVTGTTSISATSPAGAGTVDVTVTSGGQTSATSSADQFTYIAPPLITVQPSMSVASIGQPASISVTATGGALGYQWFKDGVWQIGQTNSSISFASFQFTNCGAYNVVVTNTLGLVISLPGFLTVPNARLTAWGDNSSGQLGIGSATRQSYPMSVVSNVVSMAAGSAFSFFLKNDGTLWAMGNNGSGQFGNGTTTSVNAPVQVMTNVVAVSAGQSDTLFVKGDGTLWGMGSNSYGELGNGNTTEQNSPVLIATNVVAAAEGYWDSLFLKSDGSLWAMGVGNWGQLGYGGTSPQHTPIVVASNVVSVAAGASHSLFLKRDGTMWATGQNVYGQLGIGNTTGQNSAVSVASNVVAVTAAQDDSFYLKNDGTLWAMGANTFGELGNGTTAEANSPVSVASNVVSVAAGYYQTLFVEGDGSLWAMGNNANAELGVASPGSTNAPLRIPGVVVASLGLGGLADFSLAVAQLAPEAPALTNLTINYGQSWSWTNSVTDGDGPFSYQWLFNGTNIPGATNASFTGANAGFGDIGTYAETISGTYGSVTQSATLAFGPQAGSLTNLNVIFGQSWSWTISVVAADGPFTYQWQFNGTNIPGATNATFTGVNADPATLGTYSVIVTGVLGAETHSATLTGNEGSPVIASQPAGGVVNFGQAVSMSATATPGYLGDLGYQWFKDGVLQAGQTNSTLSLASFQFTNSGSYRLVVTNTAGIAISTPVFLSAPSARLFAWGTNGNGQLGDAGTSTKTSPENRGSNAVAVAAGTSYSFYVRSDGTLWAMGLNTSGQLGIGSTTQKTSPVLVSNNVVAVAAGGSHSLYVGSDATLWAAGLNGNGQLGIGNTTSKASPVQVTNNVVGAAAGTSHSLFLRNDGTLWAMGLNASGQQGTGNTTQHTSPVLVTNNVVAMAAGGAFSLFVRSDGTLWAMGLNSSGQLGIGSTTAQRSPVLVTNNVVAVAAGATHSLFVTGDGTLWAMGLNASGQLGIGNTTSKTSPVQVTNNVVAVAAGANHSLFVKGDGTLWSMGLNTSGQLGIGNTTQKTLPVLVPNLVVASLGGMDQSSSSLVSAEPPGVLVTLSAPSAAYTNSGSVSYTVTFSESNFTSASLPALSVLTNTTGTATITSIAVTPGTGTATSTNFSVTLSGFGGNGTLGITIPAGLASDSAGNSNNATVSPTFTVDTIAPTVAVSAPSVASTNGGSVSYTVTYSDANLSGATLSPGGITLNTTGTASAGSVVVTPGAGTSTTTNYTVTLSNLSGAGTLGITVASGTVLDLAGNGNPSSSPSGTFIVDTTIPTVTISAPSAALTNSGSVSYTVTFGDGLLAGSSLTSAAITTTTTGTAASSSLVVTPGGGTATSTNYLVTFSGLSGNGSVGFTIPAGSAYNAVGVSNTATASGTFAVDTAAPSITINAPSVSATSGGNVTYTVTYHDAHFGHAALTPSSIRLTDTGTASATVLAVAGAAGSSTGTNYTVTVGQLTGDGTVAISVVAGTAVDLVGNTSGGAGPGAAFTVNTMLSPVGLYVANSAAGTVSRVSTNGSVSVFASGFNGPEGLAFDALGNLYVANYGNGIVSKVTSAGVTTTYASGLYGPQSLAFDSLGNLYVSNYRSNTVSRIATNGVVSTFATGFNGPNALVFDAAGNLYVANVYNGFVSKVAPGGAVTTYATGFNGPSGLAFDLSGNLYVSGAADNAVWKVATNGVVTSFAGGITDPAGLVFDGSGNLYVAGISGGAVSQVTPGGTVTAYASGFSTPVGLAIQNPAARLQILLPGETNAPNTIAGKTGSPLPETAGASFKVTVNAVDGNGVVVPGASPMVALSSSDSSATLPANAALFNGSQTFTVTFATPGAQTLTATDTTAINPVASGSSSSVQVVIGPTARLAVSLPGTATSGIAVTGTVTAEDAAGNPTPGYAGTVSFSSIDGAALLPGNLTLSGGTGTFIVTLQTPGSQTVTAADTLTSSIKGTSGAVVVGSAAEPVGLYVANAGLGTVSLVATNGTVSTLVSGLNGPEGVAFDRYGNLYTANYGGNTVSKVNINGVAVKFAGGFNGPRGMAFDSAGNLYVANYKGNTISKVTPYGVVSTFATGFNGPAGLAFDSAGNLYAGNVYGASISKVTPGGVVTSYFGQFATPDGLAFDTAGNLYISSLVNNEVWKVATNGVASIFASGISAPGDLVFDGSGNLYVSSISGGTVLQVTPGGTVTTYASGFNTPVGLAIQNPAVGLQVLLPGESAAPNTLAGKTGAPTLELAGVSFAVTVNAVDGNWVVVPGAAPTVAISSSDSAALLPANATLANGSQTFNVTLNSGGAQTVSAADTAGSNPLASGTSSSVQVGTGVATHFAVVLPGAALAGQAVGGTVTALDAFGNLVAGYTGTVRFSSTDPAAGLPGNATLVGGTGTFSFTLQTAGSQTVTATDTVTSSITGTSGGVAVTGSSLGVGLYVANQASSTISKVATNGAVTTVGSGFNGPEGLTFDAQGNLYVANYGNNTVSKVTTSGLVTTYASGFNAPQGLAFDSAGNLYVANYKGNTVSKVTTNGVVSTFATGFNGPAAMVFDGAGNLYVANVYGGNVSRVTPGGVVTTYFGQFATAEGLAFDPAGNLYISAVINNEVWKVATNGAATVFASGVNAPGHLAFDGSGNLYVTSISDGTVSQVTPGGTVTTYASGFGTPVGLAIQNPAAGLQILLPGETAAPNTTAGKTGTPTPVTAGASFLVTVNAVDGNWVVVPASSPTVAITSSDASATLPVNAALVNGTQTFAVALAGSGSQTLTATDTAGSNPLASNTSSAVVVGSGAATRLAVTLPGTATSGIAFTGTVTALDAFGNTAKGYTGTIQFSSTDGGAVLPANATLNNGTGTFGFTLTTPGGQTVTATDTVSASINGTSGAVTVGGAAEPLGLYVANAGLGTVSLVATNGTVTTLAGGFNGPEGMAFDRYGNLFVANYGNNTVSRVGTNGASARFAGGFNGPQGLAFDSAGNLYVSNYKSNTVSKVTAAGVVTMFAGGFNGPNALAFDGAGNLYVGNAYGSSVSKVTPGGLVSTFAGGLGGPTGLAFDGVGNLYVSDASEDVVWKVTPNGVVSTYATGLSQPAGLAVDGAGNLFVANLGNGVVSQVAPGGAVTSYASGFSTPVGLAILNPAVGLQILLPGESAAPNTITGKAGSPNPQAAGTSFSIMVNAVDGNGVVAPGASPVVALSSSDGAAVLPSNAALVSGTQTFTVTLNTVGSQTVTATDTTLVNPLSANTSSSVAVSTAEILAYRGTVRGGGRPASGASVDRGGLASPDGTPATPLELTLSAPGAAAPGTGSPVVLTISGVVGTRLQVLVSIDLSNPAGWTVLTNLTLTASPVSFADPSDALPTTRFYRVIQTP